MDCIRNKQKTKETDIHFDNLHIPLTYYIKFYAHVFNLYRKKCYEYF